MNFVPKRYCKFNKVVFADSDENRKLQLLDGMKSLMNPKTSVKRQIEVADIVSEAKRLKCNALKLPNEMWMKILSYLKNKDIFSRASKYRYRYRKPVLSSIPKTGIKIERKPVF